MAVFKDLFWMNFLTPNNVIAKVMKISKFIFINISCSIYLLFCCICSIEHSVSF